MSSAEVLQKDGVFYVGYWAEDRKKFLVHSEFKIEGLAKVFAHRLNSESHHIGVDHGR